MIKILFLINSLGGGGAEKVLVNLVNNMDKTVFDITVETMFDDGINLNFLSKDIKYISKKAPCPHGIAYLFRFLSPKLLYKFFIGKEKYDIIVAYMHGAPVKVISGCPDSQTRKIAWLHNGNPETGTFFKFWFSRKTAFAAYENCDAVVGVAESVADSFSEYTGIKEKIHVVYNTNDVKKIKEMAKNTPQETDDKTVRIISVGRISKEKGFDRFFFVCNKLKNEGYKFEVTLVGSGEDENKIKEMITESNADSWFHLTGYQSNPYPFITDSDIFVCPSYKEGLSTAVTEAVILGKPVVSTDVSGAKEILGKNNEYGIVTENSEEGLYEGIKKMLSDEKLRNYYSEKAEERAEFFSTENTVAQAEKIFYSLMR